MVLRYHCQQISGIDDLTLTLILARIYTLREGFEARGNGSRTPGRPSPSSLDVLKSKGRAQPFQLCAVLDAVRCLNLGEGFGPRGSASRTPGRPSPSSLGLKLSRIDEAGVRVQQGAAVSRSSSVRLAVQPLIP